YPSYEASDFYLGGSISHCTHLHFLVAQPDVNLSAQPAPLKQTRQSNGLSVARIEVLLFPVASVMRPLDPTPSLQPHYGPSPLLRVGPPQCSASVRSPRGFRRLGFSLHIRATGSCRPPVDSECRCR